MAVACVSVRQSRFAFLLTASVWVCPVEQDRDCRPSGLATPKAAVRQLRDPTHSGHPALLEADIAVPANFRERPFRVRGAAVGERSAPRRRTDRTATLSGPGRKAVLRWVAQGRFPRAIVALGSGHLPGPARKNRARGYITRCVNAGNCDRTSAMRAGSTSPTTMPGPSSFSTTTVPHGSTSIEWPHVLRPFGCSPPCAAAST
jgi:hypothetical protein